MAERATLVSRPAVLHTLQQIEEFVESSDCVVQP